MALPEVPTDQSKVAQVVEWFRANGYAVTEPPVPTPVHKCAMCGITDDENAGNGYGPLVDIEIRIAYGEEGTANPTRYFCNDHLIQVSRAFVTMGFGVHRHGGINFLEAECPGSLNMGDCPTPVDREDMEALD